MMIGADFAQLPETTTALAESLLVAAVACPLNVPDPSRSAAADNATATVLENLLDLKKLNDLIDERIDLIFGIATPFRREQDFSNSIQ